MSPRRRAAAAALGALAGAAVLAGGAAARPAVVYRTSGVVRLAASGNRVTVARDAGRGCIDLLALDLRGGARRTACAAGDAQDTELNDVAQDDARTSFTTIGTTGNEEEHILTSFGRRGLVRFDGFEAVDRSDQTGTSYESLAGSGGLSAALIASVSVTPSDCDFDTIPCTYVRETSPLQLATATRARVVRVTSRATGVVVGDGAAIVTTATPGALVRVLISGRRTALSLVPAPADGARILVGGRRIVAVKGGRVDVYRDPAGTLVRTLHLDGPEDLLALHGSLLVSRDATGIHVLDLATGKAAEVVRRWRAVPAIRFLATGTAGISYTSRRSGAGEDVVLVPWSDVRAALAAA